MVDATTKPSAATILVIDDEDYVTDMVANALELEGYSTQVAYNGRAGLALAQKVPADLIIIDIMMPYLNGITLMQQLRELDSTAHVPIILISAGAVPSKLPSGVIFLPKPFDLDGLLTLVAEQLGATE